MWPYGTSLVKKNREKNRNMLPERRWCQLSDIINEQFAFTFVFTVLQYSRELTEIAPVCYNQDAGETDFPAVVILMF